MTNSFRIEDCQTQFWPPTPEKEAKKSKIDAEVASDKSAASASDSAMAATVREKAEDGLDRGPAQETLIHTATKTSESRAADRRA